jgi:outer membrane protein assembly factor BamB
MRAWAIVCATVGLVACATESHIVREEPAPRPEFEARVGVEELWTKNIGWSGAGHDLALTPALDAEVLYAADRKGWVSAFEVASGKRRWEVELDIPLTSGVALGDDFLVVANSKGIVLALRKADGSVLWRAAVSSEVLAPAGIFGGMVVVQTVDGKLFALSALDGKRQWLYERSEPALSLRGTGTPLILGDQVLAGFASGKLAVLNMKDGRLIAEFPVAEPRGRNEIERLVDVDVAPLVLGETLFVVSFQGRLSAMDTRNGRITWSRDFSSHNGIATDRNNLYLTDDRGRVFAIDLRTGATVWKQDRLRDRGVSGPTYTDGHIVVSDFEGHVYWLAAEDGQLVATQQVGFSAIRSRALVRGRTWYVANEDGTLAALRLKQL